MILKDNAYGNAYVQPLARYGDWFTDLTGAVTSVANTIGTAVKAGQPQPTTSAQFPYNNSPPPNYNQAYNTQPAQYIQQAAPIGAKDNTMLYAAGGVALLAVALIALKK